MVRMLHSAGSTANVQRMHHVTVKTGFRGDARDSPPDFSCFPGIFLQRNYDTCGQSRSAIKTLSMLQGYAGGS